MTKPPSFVLLGTGGLFTTTVIKSLIDQSHYPVAYIQAGAEIQTVPTSFKGIELEVSELENPLRKLLRLDCIPFYYESELDIVSFIKSLSVEFLLIACWPKLLSDEVLGSVESAALNLHPSILPRFRGANPVGDQLNSSDDHFGVSLHILNDQFDAGDIVLQKSIKPPDKTSRAVIEKAAATIGAELFIQALQSYKNPGWSLTEQQ